MYTSRGFREWEIGDIDVIRRGRKYHLFHLVLPNHDYIAHAVSEDGMTWKRARNAIFTGEPGAWDDDMLWTMHVSKSPGRNFYEMFYTGLQRAENGYIQRIGRAVSRDLMRWRKENELNLPLLPAGVHYEAPGGSVRGWISFRDPFVFRHEDQDWLLLCARVTEGPASRRGCVGLIRRTAQSYESEAPLFYPRMYDDIECPCLIQIGGTFYLIGSIREDIEIHYWHCDSFRGEYQAFSNNTLLPKGNYAARTMLDGSRYLVYTFYIDGLNVESGTRTLPPPKELRQRVDGKLELVSFHRWGEKQRSSRRFQKEEFRALLGNPAAACDGDGEHLRFSCRSGYELFTVLASEGSWIWEAEWQTLKQGQCGLVFSLDDQLNGYFIAMDTERGSAQIRAWGSRPERVFQNYIYENLQASEFTPIPDRRYSLRLIRWGGYIELSINGVVRLSLVDNRFAGRNVGIYLESAEIALSIPVLRGLAPPQQSHE